MMKMSKAIIKTVMGETIKVEFGETDTPRDVMKRACEEDFEATLPFFENREKAERFLETGNLDLQTSQFSLIDGSEKTLSLDFDVPILEQLRKAQAQVRQQPHREQERVKEAVREDR